MTPSPYHVPMAKKKPQGRKKPDLSEQSEYLRSVRAKYRWTMLELASRLKTHLRSYQRWELGLRVMPPYMAELLRLVIQEHDNSQA